MRVSHFILFCNIIMQMIVKHCNSKTFILTIITPSSLRTKPGSKSSRITTVNLQNINMRFFITLLCSILEIPFLIIAWIDVVWNLLCKILSKISIIFVLPALITMPITWIHGFFLASLVYIKHNVNGDNISFSDAININISRFPQL